MGKGLLAFALKGSLALNCLKFRLPVALIRRLLRGAVTGLYLLLARLGCLLGGFIVLLIRLLPETELTIANNPSKFTQR